MFWETMPDGRCVPGARGTHVPPAHTGLESPAGPSIKCSQMNRKATCPKRWLLWEEASSGCFHLPLHQQQAPEGGAQGQGHRVWPEEQGRGPTLHPRQRQRAEVCRQERQRGHGQKVRTCNHTMGRCPPVGREQQEGRGRQREQRPLHAG